jgi:putative Ca2+/H+ antiporter (TMEM165/GDT1 family)
MSFEAFAVSTGVVALGEIGDKTQLLALLLAARFRKPIPIVLGILVATLANHAGAAALGDWLTRQIDPQWMRWILGASFLAVAVWMLIPDKADEVEGGCTGRWGVFGLTVAAFFLAEMGDKTQIATVMLAAKYHALVTVTAGTTLGMMIANVPAVLLGERATRFVPLQVVHRIAAAVFAVLGVLVLSGLAGT